MAQTRSYRRRKTSKRGEEPFQQQHGRDHGTDLVAAQTKLESILDNNLVDDCIVGGDF